MYALARGSHPSRTLARGLRSNIQCQAPARDWGGGLHPQAHVTGWQSSLQPRAHTRGWQGSLNPRAHASGNNSTSPAQLSSSHNWWNNLPMQGHAPARGQQCGFPAQIQPKADQVATVTEDCILQINSTENLNMQISSTKNLILWICLTLTLTSPYRSALLKTLFCKS